MPGWKAAKKSENCRVRISLGWLVWPARWLRCIFFRRVSPVYFVVGRDRLDYSLFVRGIVFTILL